MNQESRENYGDEAAEVATAISQGDNEFDGADDEYEEARAEENTFDAAHTEESAERARFTEGGEPGRAYGRDGE